ncbi:MAG: short-chain dehydrogenase [Chloroflexi bacterium HGW-Chloroflexi-10]|nr:MAG: short-chain dehydrogenase [Chloroflexi bacterium HGW-Chloroflexi-10]
MQIKNSVILITGAATRVGREIALFFAQKGANISFSYYLEDEPWKETKKDIEAFGVKCLATRVEIRQKSQIDAMVAATKETFGKVDVLINNASVWLKTPFLNISESEWELSLDVNLKGPFMCSQAVAPIMLAQGQGVIINITDLSAFQVWPGYAHHAASKAGLVALTKSLAFELAPAIRVNAIAPGTVLLPPNPAPEKVQWAVDKSVLKRVGSPIDVAQVAQLMIENDFITGTVYHVDGGRSLV